MRAGFRHARDRGPNGRSDAVVVRITLSAWIYARAGMAESVRAPPFSFGLLANHEQLELLMAPEH
jgi:hypothetical protein